LPRISWQIPVIKGLKQETLQEQKKRTIEALIQDGKALQAGTSHFLGQILQKLLMSSQTPKGSRNMFGNIMGGFNRLMGALVMTHSDDQGWYCRLT
jgi:prolyl-tRNA synthetase